MIWWLRARLQWPRGIDPPNSLEKGLGKLQALGYQVIRVDVDHNYDEFATYSNSVLANGIALVPQYSNSSKNRAALDAYRSLGYQAVGIDSTLIIKYSGATHCLSMQVPAGN